MAPAIITLLYPAPGTGAKPFDDNYYTSSHMPLVDKTWKSQGLTSWNIVKLDPSSGYVMQAILFFESLEKFQTAAGTEDGKKIFADIPNYSTTQPVTYVGGEILKG